MPIPWAGDPRPWLGREMAMLRGHEFELERTMRYLQGVNSSPARMAAIQKEMIRALVGASTVKGEVAARALFLPALEIIGLTVPALRSAAGGSAEGGIDLSYHAIQHLLPCAYDDLLALGGPPGVIRWDYPAFRDPRWARLRDEEITIDGLVTLLHKGSVAGQSVRVP